MPTSYIVGKLIEIAKDQTIAKKDGGSYEGTRLTYRTEDNQLKEQVFHNNVLKYNPGIVNALAALKEGDDFTIRKEKEGDFWNVKGITKGKSAAPVITKSGGAATPRSTYETPEERAKRQVLIVRQSSMSNAIAYSAQLEKPLSEKKIIDTAETIVKWVFQEDKTEDNEIV